MRPITVPAGAGAELTFNALWNEEEGWDFGFVQISTDGGATYQSLAVHRHDDRDHDPDALPTAVENVPGFTGFSGDVQAADVQPGGLRGPDVLLAFRAFNDPATLGDGDTRSAGLLGRRRQGRRHAHLATAPP